VRQVRVKVASFDASIACPDGVDPIVCWGKVTFSLCNTASGNVGDKVDVLLHRQGAQGTIQGMNDAIQLGTTARCGSASATGTAVL
jgi:hypothetical protein